MLIPATGSREEVAVDTRERGERGKGESGGESPVAGETVCGRLG